MADTTPNPIPTEYHEMVNLLRRYYVGLLQHTTGNRCGHHTNVRSITAELNQQLDMIKNLKGR